MTERVIAETKPSNVPYGIVPMIQTDTANINCSNNCDSGCDCFDSGDCYDSCDRSPDPERTINLTQRNQIFKAGVKS